MTEEKKFWNVYYDYRTEMRVSGEFAIIGWRPRGQATSKATVLINEDNTVASALMNPLDEDSWQEYVNMGKMICRRRMDCERFTPMQFNTLEEGQVKVLQFEKDQELDEPIIFENLGDAVLFNIARLRSPKTQRYIAIQRLDRTIYYGQPCSDR